MTVMGNTNITIIQGDSYVKNVTLGGVSIDIVKDIWFSSKALNINKKLSLNNGVFELKFTPEETSSLQVGNFDYDLTLRFVDENVDTISYQSLIRILEKNNRVFYE